MATDKDREVSQPHGAIGGCTARGRFPAGRARVSSFACFRPLRLRSPVSVGGHFDVAERVALHAHFTGRSQPARRIRRQQTSAGGNPAVMESGEESGREAESESSVSSSTIDTPTHTSHHHQQSRMSRQHESGSECNLAAANSDRLLSRLCRLVFGLRHGHAQVVDDWRNATHGLLL